MDVLARHIYSDSDDNNDHSGEEQDDKDQFYGVYSKNNLLEKSCKDELNHFPNMKFVNEKQEAAMNFDPKTEIIGQSRKE